jgi:ferredoxin-NADP reductase
VTEARAVGSRLGDRYAVPSGWQVATLVERRAESPTATTLVLDVPGWPGHLAGQHLDLRLTAPDGYTAERSYSLASGPTGFVEAVSRMIVAQGHDPARVRTERFGPAGD